MPTEAELRRSENQLKQYDLISCWLRRRAQCRPLIWPGFLRRLHAVACHGFEEDSPGKFRVVDVEIPGNHDASPWQEVPGLVAELCAYVSARAPAPGLDIDDTLSDALHLGAYVLWRLNWVHPFNDGNGRVARAAAYIVCAASLGGEIAGRMHFHEFIETRGKWDYGDGLDEADDAWKEGRVDVAQLERLMRDALLAQALSGS